MINIATHYTVAKIQLKKGGKALRISEIFVLILHILYSGENSVEKRGESFTNFRNICFDFAYYSYLHSSTNRKLFHAFVYVL